MSIAQMRPAVIGGVDTHKDQHVAAALTEQGQLLATAAFPTTPAGYRQLLRWLRTFGPVQQVGIEGTGSWGAGLTHCLHTQGVPVVEVPRPSRQWRRRRGKSDPTDAEAAARAVLAGQGLGTPQRRTGTVEALRFLRVARRSAQKALGQTANQLHAVVDTAPAALREQLRGLSLPVLVATARHWRPGAPSTPLAAARFTLKLLAERWHALAGEIDQLKAQLAQLVATLAPALLALPGVGPDTASALLVAVGDQPDRLRTEPSFAALCGVSPVDASSGQQHRHRLNRGGHREANWAVWVIVQSRLRHQARTQAYRARRLQEGLSKKEIIRCLKRYVTRELYPLLRSLTASAPAPSTP